MVKVMKRHRNYAVAMNKIIEDKQALRKTWQIRMKPVRDENIITVKS